MELIEFEHLLRNSKRQLVIFGAGRWGRRLAKLCKLNKIVVTCFCDESEEYCHTQQENLPVYNLKEIQKKYGNPILILSPKRVENQNKMISLLEETQLEYYSITYFMEHIPVIYSETVMDKIWINRFKFEQYKRSDSPVLYIQSIDVMITEQCSLKCKDCGHLMQYYQKPKHRKKEDIFYYLDRLDEVFDVIGGIQILGGEPLMNADVYEIVEYAQKKKSIETVHVVTNATILPKKEKMNTFDKSKVDFVISDYENPKQKISEIQELLGEIGIACDLASSGQWIDYSEIKDYVRSEENLREIFRTCNTKNTSVLSYGNLYICPRLANAHTLEAMPDTVFEYVDLKDQSLPLSELREKLKIYLYGTIFLKACNYCNGAAIPTLPKALQIKEPLPYRKYAKGQL